MNGTTVWTAGGLITLFLVVTTLSFVPQYCVWQKGLAGKAELKQAEWNRQIVVQEALAKEEAAKSWAKAEVSRAKGAAEANEILAKSLGGSDGYLRWLFIDKLDDLEGQVIYLPTEAGLPILEANRNK